MTPSDRNDYLRNAILQSPPEQLQLMLYDGAIRFALQGRDALAKKDYETSYEKLSRAQKIVLEMEAGLRPEVSREICEQMTSLYNFVYRKLVDASVQRDTQAVDDALKILRHQRETWLLLLEKVSGENDSLTALAGDDVMKPGSLSVQG